MTKARELAWLESAIFGMDPGKRKSLIVQRLWPLGVPGEVEQRGKDLPREP